MQSMLHHPTHSVAAVLVLYWVLSAAYSIFFAMASETTMVCAMFGCEFTHGVEICYQSFPKDAILRNILFQKCRRSEGVNPNLLSCSILNPIPKSVHFLDYLNFGALLLFSLVNLLELVQLKCLLILSCPNLYKSKIF